MTTLDIAIVGGAGACVVGCAMWPFLMLLTGIRPARARSSHLGWHFHHWSKWEDVGTSCEDEGLLSHPRFYIERITQVRRCSVCNLAKTRRA